MQLQEAILHQISKDVQTSGPGSTSVTPRKAVLPIDDRLQKTAEDIVKVYGKLLSGYGTFGEDATLHQFPVFLRDYVANTTNFVSFTEQATLLISREMSKVFFANGGYALFLRYTNQGQDWLLVVMLKLRPGTGLDKATLELLDTLTFDVDHLHEAARVDLGKWAADAHPYLSFIKRGRSDDVTQYFRDALGCTEYTQSKHNTEQMKDASEAFYKAQGWNKEQEREARRRIYEYCDARLKAQEPVNLTALSAIIDDQNPEAFRDFVRESDFEVSETFKPHRDTYVSLKRIRGKFGSVTVGFDVNDVQTGRVDYDEAHQCLVITGAPSELVSEILKYKAGNNGNAAG